EQDPEIPWRPQPVERTKPVRDRTPHLFHRPGRLRRLLLGGGGFLLDLLHAFFRGGERFLLAENVRLERFELAEQPLLRPRERRDVPSERLHVAPEKAQAILLLGRGRGRGPGRRRAAGGR